MNHRTASLPISLVLALSVIAGTSSPLNAAEPGVPDTATPNNPSSAAPPQAPLAPGATATPPPAPTASTPEAPAPSTSTDRPATYTVVSGDSLWKVAHKYGTTVVKLRKLNKLKKGALLHPGQVLQLPPASSTDTTAPTPPPVKPDASVTRPSSGIVLHHKTTQPLDADVANSLRAQPVQDFDTAESTPLSILGEPAESSSSPPVAAPVATAAANPPAPRAQLVSPSELSAASSATSSAVPEETAPNSASLASTLSSKHAATPPVTDSEDAPFVDPAPLPPPQKLTSRDPNPVLTTPSDDWANRFMHVARDLADQDIDYDEAWCPPGESHAWAMDCSNTTRYIYKAATGISLPRTASDQYYYLHLQNKAWDVPQAADGYADCQFLRENLKPGDLLFWENTYRPERQPPITHVMVFLGTKANGDWLMAGSQTSRGGLHNRSHGGPDIYVFDPHKPCGGYSTWLGLVHHKGRFCAFGRPLEADKTKLAVATNN